MLRGRLSWRMMRVSLASCLGSTQEVRRLDRGVI